MRPHIVLSILAALLLSTLSHAAGPYGGTVNKLSYTEGSKGSTKLRWAATQSGLFQQSKDTWNRKKGLDGQNVLDVLETQGRVLAIVKRRGLFVSDDGAKNWKPVSKGIKSRYGHKAKDLSVLALDRGNAKTIYLGSLGKGFFKSTDRGESWQLMEGGLDKFSPAAQHVTAIHTSRDGKDLFIGTDGEGVLSYREGVFTSLSDDFPEKMRVTDIAVDPNDDTHLAVASGSHGLWESTDSGATWKQLRLGRFHLASAVAIGFDSTVLAYFTNEGFVTARKGKAGRPVKIGYKNVSTIVAKKELGWYATVNNDGIFELDAKGAVMPVRFNSGLDATSVYSLVEGKAPGSLWSGDSNGAYYSSDAGRTWERRDKGLVVGKLNKLVWNGAELYTGIGGQGVYHWNSGAGKWDNRGVAMGTANTVYSMFATSEGRIYAGTEGGVLWTDDGGFKWASSVNSTLVQSSFWSIALDSGSPQRIWAASRKGLYLSLDGGESWELSRVGTFLEVQYAGGILWLRDSDGLTGFERDKEVVRVHELGGERIVSFLPMEEGVLIGTNNGLWMNGAGGAKRLWQGAPVLSMLLTADGKLHVGTDGKGVKTFKTR